MFTTTDYFGQVLQEGGSCEWGISYLEGHFGAGGIGKLWLEMEDEIGDLVGFGRIGGLVQMH